MHGSPIQVCEMARVSVLYFGPLYDIVGKRREWINIPDSSNLLDLIDELKRKHGERFFSFAYDSKRRLRESLAFAVDGASISKSELKKIKCADVSEFVILPPISGG
jgi:molybdopterin converting factor small subunit